MCLRPAGRQLPAPYRARSGRPGRAPPPSAEAQAPSPGPWREGSLMPSAQLAPNLHIHPPRRPLCLSDYGLSGVFFFVLLHWAVPSPLLPSGHPPESLQPSPSKCGVFIPGAPLTVGLGTWSALARRKGGSVLVHGTVGEDNIFLSLLSVPS